MTRSEFISFYPQFSHWPDAVSAVLDEFVRQANARFVSFGDDAEEARRLYTAHKLTLYARVWIPDYASASMAAIANAGASGSTTQNATSKKVGEVQITYTQTNSTAAFNASTAKGFGDLCETLYGQQLTTLLRLHGRSRYIP